LGFLATIQGALELAVGRTPVQRCFQTFSGEPLADPLDGGGLTFSAAAMSSSFQSGPWLALSKMRAWAKVRVSEKV
jgi:hypothetical protein